MVPRKITDMLDTSIIYVHTVHTTFFPRFQNREQGRQGVSYALQEVLQGVPYVLMLDLAQQYFLFFL